MCPDRANDTPTSPDIVGDSPPWDELYDRCCELGIVGIEFRRPSQLELEALLRDHQRDVAS